MQAHSRILKSSATLLIWLLLFSTLITCPVRKAIKVYQDTPVAASGIYQSCKAFRPLAAVAGIRNTGDEATLPLLLAGLVWLLLSAGRPLSGNLLPLAFPLRNGPLLFLRYRKLLI